ncbi:hypothetical protein [uncultured Kordia sp.]|uniref:hypothetical protein n=1 Tax=uncultured Kordia sp. TaxID=507699 RepID=UPI002637F697|nr:hypothetical protein [uncultured Kordia sp.]
MKKIVLFLSVFFTVYATACSCDPIGITEKYIQSDFVANVTIVKIYPNEKGKELYKADIKINTLYKGASLKSIYVAGNNGGMGSSCSIFIPENTKLIAYAGKTKDGKYVIGMCSGLMYLDYSGAYRKKTRKTAKGMKSQRRELAILKLFKEKNITRTDRVLYQGKSTLFKDLDQFKGMHLKKTAAFFELTFSSDVKVKSVKMIDGFNAPVDKKLLEILKKSSWTSFYNGEKNKVPENSKFLLGIYFYESEAGYMSFLSCFYL